MFTARNMPLLWLIASAYGVSIRQVWGLPSSFSSKNYDIEATSAVPTSRQGMMKSSGPCLRAASISAFIAKPRNSECMF